MVVMTPSLQDRTLHCELLLTGGLVADGTGAPAFAAAVAIRGDRIVGIGAQTQFLPDRVQDVQGLTICPGFIDAHTHDDQALLVEPDLLFKTSQGVTTVIVGNCGVSLAPLAGPRDSVPAPLSEVAKAEDFRFPRFGDYLAALESAGAAVNTAALVGHTTLRVAHMGDLDRPADKAEAAAMLADCEAALEAGAIGLSSGLYYPPAQAAPKEEVIPLVRAVAQAGGVYAAHIRDEADAILEALEEAFAIAESTGAPLIVSHHKLAGEANFGRSRQTLPLLTQAATRFPVGFDVYPYAASSTMLNRRSWEASTRTLVTWSEPYPEAAGRDLVEIAAELGISEERALQQLSPGGAVYFMMHEGDVEAILRHPAAMIGSDGVPLKAKPHPRLYGTFPRILGHYARERGLFSFEEAVRRMTSLTAERFRLRDRGVIAPGAFADLVLVNPKTVKDEATFSEPTRLSAGVEAVFVNGVCVFASGAATGRRPGRVLRGWRR